MSKCHETSSQLHQHVATLLVCLGSLKLSGRSHKLYHFALLLLQEARFNVHALKWLQHRHQPLT